MHILAAHTEDFKNPMPDVPILAEMGGGGVLLIFLYAPIDGVPLGEIRIKLKAKLAVTPRAGVPVQQLAMIRIHDGFLKEWGLGAHPV
jgi:hypothetical protein